MKILIILIVLITIGILILVKGDYDFEFLGAAIVVVFGLYLIVHTISWATASYDYNVMKVERNTFVTTLAYARKNNNSLELATVTTKVLEWNQDLAKSQYNTTVFIIHDYTDKRVLTLTPIQ